MSKGTTYILIAVIGLIVLFGLVWLFKNQTTIPGANENTETTNPIDSSHIAGIYTTSLAAADSPGREITLILANDGTATLNTDYENNQPVNSRTGTWVSTQGGVVISLNTDNNPNQPSQTLKFTYSGSQITLQDPVNAGFGNNGLTLERNSVNSDLTEGEWQWLQTNFNDGTIVNAPNDKFVIKFNTDNTINIRTDCNTYIGSYTQNKSTLTINPTISTMIACPPPSQQDRFIRNLSGVVSFFFKNGNLILEIRYDTGSMLFRPYK